MMKSTRDVSKYMPASTPPPISRPLWMSLPAVISGLPNIADRKMKGANIRKVVMKTTAQRHSVPHQL